MNNFGEVVKGDNMNKYMITANSLQMKKTRFIIKHMGSKMGTDNMKIDYANMRKIVEKSQLLMKKSKGVIFKEEIIAGIETEFVIPDKILSDDIILYVHGGGFSTGNAKTSRAYASYLASQSGMQVCTLTYRLAPEHPFPEGLDDCTIVYSAIVKLYPESNIALVGESAGGNLVLVMALKCLKENIRMPSAICAFSPITDLSGRLLSHINNAKTDIQIGTGIDKEFRKIYSGGYEMSNPYISPLQADSLKGFAPTMLVVDQDEVLYDDSMEFANRLASDKVECDIHIFKNTFHAFPIAGTSVPEGRKVLSDTVKFIWAHMCE